MLAGLEALDPPAKKIAKKVRSLIKPRPVKEALSGSWLGHPLHPVLTDVTIGTFTSAVLLDWLGGERVAPRRRAPDRASGLRALLPTVASGYSDWADTEVASDAVRRIGIVHSAANATASCALRRVARGAPSRRQRPARWPSPAAPRSSAPATSAAT